MTPGKEKTIAVIGAGIIGVTLARRLQREGWRVLLIDASEPGMGASFGNAGFIATDEILPLSHGISFGAVLKMLLNPMAPLTIRWQNFFSLIPWFWKFLKATRPNPMAKSAAALAALQSGALAAWNKTIREEALTPHVRRNGAMIVFETEKGFTQESAKFPFLDQHEIEYLVISGDQAREMIPELGPNITKAIYYPNGLHITDPLKVTKQIHDNFTRQGGQAIVDRISRFETKDGKLQALLGSKDAYKVDAAVLAAGHQSGDLLKTLGITVPLATERGYHVIVDHPPLKFDMTFGSHERGFFITPMADGLRLAGTVEFAPAGREFSENWKRAEILKIYVEKLIPGIAGKETSRWMGHRPTLPDFLPCLGKVPDLENLYLSFGHQHLGLTLAPVCAEIICNLVTTGKTALDISPFDIQRFQ
ncbi:MAG: FAD-dependent oxidoreductase [Sphingomonadales bacterium]